MEEISERGSKVNWFVVEVWWDATLEGNRHIRDELNVMSERVDSWHFLHADLPHSWKHRRWQFPELSEAVGFREMLENACVFCRIRETINGK